MFSVLSKDGMNADVFPMRHLALSICFEGEVSAKFSPILLIDFSPVFIYILSLDRSAEGYLQEAGRLAEPN